MSDAPALNLGLNDGTYCPQSCIDLLERFSSRTSLRHYTTAENEPLLEVICKVDGVNRENIYLANGSGTLLKQCIPFIIKKKITGSPKRILRHVVSKTGFPIITPTFTYFKVPLKAANQGLKVGLVPIGPEDGFTLDLAALRANLDKHDGLVYLANPNNPTGNVLITREQLEPLLKAYPTSIFWIDEAYIQYVDPAVHKPVSDLVPQYPNLIVSRTFSFAYGLAGLRIGYLLARPDLVETFKGQVVDYRLGLVQEQMAIAALTDPEHLGFIRRECAEQRAVLTEGMEAMGGIQVIPSEANFLLARFTDGRTGAWLSEELLKRGIKIKIMKPVQDLRFDEWFRITLGTAEENQLLLARMREIVAGEQAASPRPSAGAQPAPPAK
jgi:histidinol-phosphate aminotransferase